MIANHIKSYDVIWRLPFENGGRKVRIKSKDPKHLDGKLFSPLTSGQVCAAISPVVSKNPKPSTLSDLLQSTREVVGDQRLLNLGDG